MSTNPKNIYQRINAVMAEVKYVQKDKTISMGTGGYKVITHDAVTNALHDSIQKHGIVYHPTQMEVRQEGNRTETHMVVRFANMDDKDDFIDVPTVGYGIDSGDKGPGKAVSYAVKYALLKTFGLETGEDADAEAGATHEPASKPSAPVSQPRTHYQEEEPMPEPPHEEPGFRLINVESFEKKPGAKGEYISLVTNFGKMNLFDSKYFDLVHEGSLYAKTKQSGNYVNVLEIQP